MRARRSMTTYSNYSCTRIPVDGPPTRVRVSGSLLALLTYEYPGGYGLTSQQQASVSQGRICSDNFTCCHTEIQVADPTFYLTQSQYTDTGPTSPSTDPVTPGAWQGSHWSANFEVTGMTRPRKKSCCSRDSNPGSSALEADATRPTRRFIWCSFAGLTILWTVWLNGFFPLELEHICYSVPYSFGCEHKWSLVCIHAFHSLT